ncbi:MAG: phenylacetic acid degradation protein [Burkholderiales bacterium]|nr:phenylacetic acid degradation protein [Burkholderiales bacterium]
MAEREKRGGKQASAPAIPDSPVMQGGMARALGMRLVSLTKKKVVAEMEVKPMHLNRSGRVSGGAIMAFADVVGATGAVFNLPPGHRSGTIESKSNFFTAARGPVLKAVSIPLHFGRTTTVWQTTVSNGDGKIAAIVTQTQIVIPAKSDE